MKTVHANRMVAHLWANRSQEEARNANNSFYFIGDTIYSYGRHFPIARWVGGVVLFTTRDYSNTTAKQKGYVRYAIKGGTPVFYVADPERLDHKANLKDYQKRINEYAVKAKRARSHAEGHIREMNGEIAEANRYAENFKLKTRFAAPADIDVDAMIAKSREANEKRKAEENRKREITLAKYSGLIMQWKSGANVILPYSNRATPVLRVRGSRIESSQGAIVSIEDAVKILPVIRSGVSPAEPVQVGPFHLTDVDANNVTIGCHVIPVAEIERIASELKL